MLYNEPIFFEHNRVFRVYTGGKLLGEFTGGDTADGSYPEEWIASSVRANNEGSVDPKEGISRIEGTDIYLDDLIAEHKEAILGDRSEIGILVKYLDSAVRLPIQAHPDKAFSRKHFSSNHGKEESWLVLATRPGGHIFFGFKEGVNEQIFKEAIDKSLTDKDIMETLLVKYDVEPGDFVLVPARCVHAIGAGCLILEVQEPTDFTIQPEHYCVDYKLSEREMYLGLSHEDALSCFDYTPIKDVKSAPRLIKSENGVTVEELIGERSECFSINRITVKGGKFTLGVPASVIIVTEGSGRISGEGYVREIKSGDYFLLPASAVGRFSISGNITLIESYGK